MDTPSDELSAVEHAARLLIAYIDSHAARLPRGWDDVTAYEQDAARAFVRAMRQASIEP